MSDNKLLNKAITISAKEEKLQGRKPVMKLKDEKGLTYTVYKTKQDGSTSVAWEQVQELSVGDTVQIGYVEDLGDYQGKAVTYRTIRNFNKDIGEGVKNYNQNNAPASVQSPRHGQNLASSGARDYDKEAVGKCQYGFLEAYIRSGHSFQEAKLQVVVARKLAELVVYGTQQSEPEEDLIDPALGQPEFNDEDIPF